MKFDLASMTGIKLSKPGVLVIEVGDEQLKLAAGVQNKGKGKLLWVTVDPIIEYNEIQISQKIAQILKTKNFTPEKVILAHPTKQLTTRVLSLPSTDEKEIRDIVALQAVKQTPYAKEEISSGYRIIEKSLTGYSQVFLAIAHKDISTKYCRISEIARLMPHRVVPSAEGVSVWYKRVFGKGIQGETPVVLLLDMDWLTTELLIFDETRLVFNRSLNIGAKQLAEQGEVMHQELLRDIERTLESGSVDLQGKKIGQVMITGAGERFPDLTQRVLNAFNVPCQIVPSFLHHSDLVPTSMLEPLSGDLPEKGWVSTLAVAGLVFESEFSPIDLMPEEVAVRKTLQQRGKDLAMLGTLLMAFIMVVSGIVYGKIYKKNAYLDEIKKAYDKVHQDSEGIERIVAKMKLANEQMIMGGNVLDVLRDIQQVMPPSITLTSMQFNEKEKNVVIRGISQEMSAVFQFLSSLEATPQLEFVKTRNVTKRKMDEESGGGEIAEFEMVANLEAKGNQVKKGEIRPAVEALKGEK